MRILHVCHSLNPASGGPTDSVHMFAQAHQRAGNTVEIATLDDPGQGFDQVPGATVHPLGPGKGVYAYQPRLVSWLKENRARFDGVIANGVWQFQSLAVRKAFAGNTPYLVFSHGMLDPYFNQRYPLKYLKKLAYWVAFEQRNLTASEAVCFTSDVELQIAAKGFPGASFRRVLVPYGTLGPPEGDRVAMRAKFQEQLPRLDGRPYLLYLSRIHPKKGCDLLLEAFARTAPAEWQLVMAGPDGANLVPELQAQAQSLGIAERVHWPGMIRGDVKWGAFYGAEAFILPSHQENFGIAVADALACGVVPLISDKVNIAADVAADGAGLVESDTVEGTARLIRRFVELNPDERLRMQQQGIVCYQQRYALRHSAEAVYRALGLVNKD